MPASSIVKTALDALAAKRSVLSVGYNPIAENGDRYKELLDLMDSEAVKRQSPLVNAGYAIRLSVVTDTIHAFLQNHADQPVQLVILGCGLDILGLWAKSSTSDLTVYELDTLDIVQTKRDLLLSNGLLSEKSDNSAVLSGCIIGPRGATSDVTNYHLYNCDLRKIDEVASCLGTVDKTKPTLVLSELVLTYLGNQSTDNLLTWCAQHLCTSPGSVMVAYEPLGPKAPIRHSVLEGYKQAYCQKFIDKLSRGLAKFDPQELFGPLGYDTSSAENRFRKASFDTVLAALAGYAMAARTEQGFTCPESFDEHAALDLHLRSYALVMGFPKFTDLRLIRQMCPWSLVVKHDFEAEDVLFGDALRYTIRRIEARDQESVRGLYRQTYEGLFEQYPSVRKMVKTGLKTDLGCNVADDLSRNFSSIAARFGLAGGVFLVAVDNNSSLLLGCVGIRLCQAHEHRLEGYDDQLVFEIHRLAVKPERRGLGVGKKLLEMMDVFLTKELGVDEPYSIIASTPAILSAANNLYKSSGFELTKEELIGKMVINSYCCSRSHTKT